MLVILSPAKNLDFTNTTNDKFLKPNLSFKDKTSELVEILEHKSQDEIKQLMKLSDKLSHLNYQRYQNFYSQPQQHALFAFKGDVYNAMDVDNYQSEEINFAAKHLAILSGLYGILGAMDPIRPYRLEMGTKLTNSSGEDLYDFWDELISLKINQLLSDHENKILLNLASNEYFKSVNMSALKYPCVHVVFKENRLGEYKIIGLNAKKARGMMADYIIKNKIDDPDAIKDFNIAGYSFNAKLSNNQNLVFTRDG